MRKLFPLAASLVLLLLACKSNSASPPSSSTKPQSTWETYSCQYNDLNRNVAMTGKCHKEKTTINGNFGYIVTWPSGNKVRVEYVKSQSGNHIWKLNDQSAVAIEINREHLRGFSLDLNQIIEWQDNP